MFQWQPCWPPSAVPWWLKCKQSIQQTVPTWNKLASPPKKEWIRSYFLHNIWSCVYMEPTVSLRYILDITHLPPGAALWHHTCNTCYRAEGAINDLGHTDNLENLCSSHVVANRTSYQNQTEFISTYIQPWPYRLDSVVKGQFQTFTASRSLWLCDLGQIVQQAGNFFSLII